MAGQFRNKKFEFNTSQKTLISEWIVSSIKGSEWVEGYDLHIDEIVQYEIPKNLWVTMSLSLIEFAQEELFRLDYADIIPIVFLPLYGDERPRGISFTSLREMENELDLTPPSLFVCPKNWNGFREAYSDRKIISDMEFANKLYTIYYYEAQHDNGLEHVRNVSILPSDQMID